MKSIVLHFINKLYFNHLLKNMTIKCAASTLEDLAVECGSSCVFRCVRVRMSIQELCTYTAAVEDRTRACETVNSGTAPYMIRT